MVTTKKSKIQKRIIRRVSKPLTFSNPFYSGYKTNRRTTRIFSAPLMSNSMTSSEMGLQSEAGLNSALMGDDPLKVDMNEFTSNLVALPDGVTSIEQLSKDRDTMRQIERYNAGILNSQRTKQKRMYEVAQNMKRKELKRKIIQYLAESDEIDQVPAEYREAVKRYYEVNYKNAGPTGQQYKDAAEFEAAIKALRDEKKEGKLKKQREREAFETLMGRKLESLNEIADRQRPASEQMFDRNNISQMYTSSPVVNTQKLEALNRRLENLNGIKEQLLRDLDGYYEAMGLPDISDDDYKSYAAEVTRAREGLARLEIDIRSLEQQMHEVMQGHGIIGGWHAPRLFNLVRPYKKFEIPQTPAEIVDEQKNSLDSNRNLYKEKLNQLRGMQPPKGMVERAFPNTAEPLYTEQKKIPLPGFIPHPFLFKTQI